MGNLCSSRPHRHRHRSDKYYSPRGSHQGDAEFAEGRPSSLQSKLSHQTSRASEGDQYYDATDSISQDGGGSMRSMERQSPAMEERGLGKLISRLSLRRSTSPGARSWRRSGEADGMATVSTAQGTSLVPADAVIMAEAPAAGTMPCLPLFSPGVPDKKFVRIARPAAGSSIPQHKEGAEPKDPVFAWCEPSATTFMVRGEDYMKSKRKVQCEMAVYRLVNVDVYSFDFKIHHIARHVGLPEAPRLSEAARALPPEQQLPPLLLVNIQLPTYPAGLFGPHDGKGFSLVYYFALPDNWSPDDVPNKSALALLQRFFQDGREADNWKSRDRLKLIPRVVNVEQWAKEGPLSGAEHKLLANYNDKPLLTKPQHRYFSGPGYFEISLDIHNYAFLARKAFGAFIPRLAPVVFENAFVIQGNSSDELPEVILGAARLYRIDFMQERPFPAKLVQSDAQEE